MIPVQISTKLEGKVYTATLRCVLKGQEHIAQTKGSGYIKTGFQYLNTWQKADWKKSNGNPVANADLWQKVAEAAKIHKITIFLI